MKPKTFKKLCEQFWINVQNMDIEDMDEERYHEMEIENEMIERFMVLENKKKPFNEWSTRCYVEIDARSQNL